MGTGWTNRIHSTARYTIHALNTEIVIHTRKDILPLIYYKIRKRWGAQSHTGNTVKDTGLCLYHELRTENKYSYAEDIFSLIYYQIRRWWGARSHMRKYCKKYWSMFDCLCKVIYEETLYKILVYVCTNYIRTEKKGDFRPVCYFKTRIKISFYSYEMGESYSKYVRF